MNHFEHHIAFGPIPSRRLGRSLGVNNITAKVCSYACRYCQVGPTTEQRIEPRPFFTPEQIRASIAVGVLAFLDNQPCHCEDLTRQKPQATHLAYYDGYKWRTLRSGLFPGQGDFLLREGMSLVALTVKSSTVKNGKHMLTTPEWIPIPAIKKW